MFTVMESTFYAIIGKKATTKLATKPGIYNGDSDLHLWYVGIIVGQTLWG